MQSTKTIGMASVLAVASSLILAPTVASAAGPETQVVSVPMLADCSGVDAEELARMDRAELGLCGAAGADPGTRGQVTGTCGTASIYTDRSSNGKGRVSWGLHSTKGVMIARDLQVTWGPAGGNTIHDITTMYSADYSNSRTVLGNGKLGASMHGNVGLLGWTITCGIPSVYASSVNI